MVHIVKFDYCALNALDIIDLNELREVLDAFVQNMDNRGDFISG